MAEIHGDPDRRIIAFPNETETPIHLRRLFSNLGVSSTLENRSLSEVKTSEALSVDGVTATLESTSISSKESATSSDIQKQIDEMHTIHEQERDMHTAREKETMHTLHEREKHVENSREVIKNTRIALAAIEAWGRKGGTSMTEVNDIRQFIEDLNSYLTRYTDVGELGFPDRIIAAARRYITPDVVDSLYGANEDHRMVIDDNESAEEIRKIIAPIISHDLRTPITALYGSAQLLERFGLAGVDDPKIRERIEGRREAMKMAQANLANEALYLHDLVEEGLTMDEFTGQQVGEQMKKLLGENTVVHISEDALQSKMYSCEKWFQRLLPNMRKNADEQYEIRDKKYSNRAEEIDAEGNSTKGQMIVTIDTVTIAVPGGDIKKIRIRVGDIATGFPEIRLIEGFKSRGTDKAEGTGRALAFSKAIGDKIYQYTMEPQTVVRNSNGNVTKLIEAELGKLVEKEVKDGEVVPNSEREITPEEYAKVAEQPNVGAQTEILARIIE